MDYKLKIGEETTPIEVNTSNNDKLNFIISEKDYKVDYYLIDNHHIHLDINGKRINAYVTSDDTGKTITINGNSIFIEDAEALELMKKGEKKGFDLPDSITPPMPAIVITALVKEGDIVKKGQGVIVVSAMKMETTLFAPYSGKVININTAEGEKVNPGDILVNIEKDENTDEAIEKNCA